MQKDFYLKKEFTDHINVFILPEEFSIEITSLRLFGAHGIYYEETLVQNEFELNVRMKYFPEAIIENIDQTLDYVKAFQVIKTEFDTPTPLLETLAQMIAVKLKEVFPVIHFLEVHIIKLHAPITSFTGEVGIRYQKNF
jgi:7,8-dihydroneopterin aldolase/epimerase/oxygenase